MIAATNRNLEDQVRAGKFRDDLYYRLNVLRLEMPPLRDRDGDAILLARQFIQTFSAEFRRPVKGLSEAAERALGDYPWPGNVRELRNLVERAVLLAEADTLEPEDFESIHTLRPSVAATAATDFDLPSGGINLEDLEKHLVTRALQRTKGNQTRAAALLGLHRDQIRYRIEKFGLKAGDPASATSGHDPNSEGP